MPTIYKRSLIRMGKGGLVISIPKSWTRYYGLKPGDRLEMIASSRLVVKPLTNRREQMHKK